ncbi:C-type lectin domain family 4 member M-like [Asterias amurensis]|uniref:C-type lectin domain family 4 member M-like n=1 Tax=Asterias amurensis TaxID=7602 RepID=UPI003AB11138
MVCKMLASKLLGVVGLIMANYAAVNGRCWKKAPITGGTPQCPPTWSQWQDKCYKMNDDFVTWEEGKQICFELGGVMVVPQSKEEIQHLLNMCSWNSFWIGCNDIENEGTWVCLDGEGTVDVQDKRWDDDEPNSDGDEGCAAGSASGWFDFGCDVYTKLICQRHV